MGTAKSTSQGVWPAKRFDGRHTTSRLSPVSLHNGAGSHGGLRIAIELQEPQSPLVIDSSAVLLPDWQLLKCRENLCDGNLFVDSSA